jgi:hypothetical protein
VFWTVLYLKKTMEEVTMANIYGTNKDDTLKGTKYDDNIYAYGGDDKAYA